MTQPSSLSRAIDEFKHSIKMHILLNGGPSERLCVFLLKSVDFIEDEDKQRSISEMVKISYYIIEDAVKNLHDKLLVDDPLRNELSTILKTHDRTGDFLIRKYDIVNRISNFISGKKHD